MTLEEAKDFLLNRYICCCPYGFSPTNCGDDKCVFGMAIRTLCSELDMRGTDNEQENVSKNNR